VIVVVVMVLVKVAVASPLFLRGSHFNVFGLPLLFIELGGGCGGGGSPCSNVSLLMLCSSDSGDIPPCGFPNCSGGGSGGGMAAAAAATRSGALFFLLLAVAPLPPADKLLSRGLSEDLAGWNACWCCCCSA